MAGITFFGGVEMVCVFAGGDGAIMATGANANDFIVIYIGRRDRLPGCWSDGMTGIAIIRRSDMRCAFTGCDRSIMAANTTTRNFIVIYVGRRDRLPWCWPDGMTGIAIIRRSDMRCPFTAGDGSIVTTDAGTDDLRVIYCSWLNGCPGGREYGMTTVALVC